MTKLALPLLLVGTWLHALPALGQTVELVSVLRTLDVSTEVDGGASDSGDASFASTGEWLEEIEAESLSGPNGVVAFATAAASQTSIVTVRGSGLRVEVPEGEEPGFRVDATAERLAPGAEVNAEGSSSLVVVFDLMEEAGVLVDLFFTDLPTPSPEASGRAALSVCGETEGCVFEREDDDGSLISAGSFDLVPDRYTLTVVAEARATQDVGGARDASATVQRLFIEVPEPSARLAGPLAVLLIAGLRRRVASFRGRRCPPA